MKIHLPNSAFLGNIDPFLRSFVPSDPNYLEITSNEKWVSVHPMILSMVTALGLTVGPKNIRCSDFTAKSKNYFLRMNLFNILDISFDESYVKHESSGRFIPLTIVKSAQQQTQLIKDIIPLLHLQSEPEQAKTIAYIISELIDNVLEHAGTSIGAIICVQYYKKSNCIRIGIADTGVGIKETINRSHIAPTQMKAIQLALTPGITGTTRREGGTDFNAGAGLFFIKSIASVNRDFFIIYSGDSFYKMLKKSSETTLHLQADPFADRHSKSSNLPYWKGTAIGIDITLDQTIEFSLLLKAINKIYGPSVRARRKARYKAKFI